MGLSIQLLESGFPSIPLLFTFREHLTYLWQTMSSQYGVIPILGKIIWILGFIFNQLLNSCYFSLEVFLSKHPFLPAIHFWFTYWFIFESHVLLYIHIWVCTVGHLHTFTRHTLNISICEEFWSIRILGFVLFYRLCPSRRL